MLTFGDVLKKARGAKKYREREAAGQLGLFGAPQDAHAGLPRGDDHEIPRAARDKRNMHEVAAADHRARGHKDAAEAHDEAALLHAAGDPGAAEASRRAHAETDKATGGKLAAAAERLDAAKKKAVDKPPPGFHPAPKSKKGGWTDGHGSYWYPGKGVARVGEHGGEHGEDSHDAHHEHLSERHEELAEHHEAAAQDRHRSMESRGLHQTAAKYHRGASSNAAFATGSYGDPEVGARAAAASRFAHTVGDKADDHDRDEWDREDADHKAQHEKHKQLAADAPNDELRQLHEDAADAHDEAHRHGRGSIDTRARSTFSERAHSASAKADRAGRKHTARLDRKIQTRLEALAPDPNAAASASMKKPPTPVAQAARASVESRSEGTPRERHAALRDE